MLPARCPDPSNHSGLIESMLSPAWLTLTWCSKLSLVIVYLKVPFGVSIWTMSGTQFSLCVNTALSFLLRCIRCMSNFRISSDACLVFKEIRTDTYALAIDWVVPLVVEEVGWLDASRWGFDWVWNEHWSCLVVSFVLLVQQNTDFNSWFAAQKTKKRRHEWY